MGLKKFLDSPRTESTHLSSDTKSVKSMTHETSFHTADEANAFGQEQRSKSEDNLCTPRERSELPMRGRFSRRIKELHFRPDYKE